ncbi:NAD(P)-dependent oxidoreductase [Planktomarina temperata]|nr:NAD(P)-dependent oxidoreductase [Planktomarina temperata]MDC1094182.1 NAD(P)-dependent oxidoreductase [Planktomarina temperata]
MAKVSIIGGAGFVGTYLCKQLIAKGWDFEIIDIKASNSFPERTKIGDIRNLQSLREKISGDFVVNLAAIHRDDVQDLSQYHETNVLGSRNITKVCTEKGIKNILFTSSVAVYGYADPDTDEEGKIEPFNEYGRTKFEAEEVFRKWQKEGDYSLTIVRPTVIFGEGNRGNVFNLFNQIESGKFFMIGSGENKKSMAYVQNVAAFLETCLGSKKKYLLSNYVDAPDLTMNELVSLVRFKLKGKYNVGLRIPYMLGLFIGYACDTCSKILNVQLSISALRIKKFTSSTQFKSAQCDLEGFAPPFSLVDAIEQTLHSEFVVKNPNKEIFYTE